MNESQTVNNQLTISDKSGGFLSMIEENDGRQFEAFGIDESFRWPVSLLLHRHSMLSPDWQAPLSFEQIRKLTLDLDSKRYSGAPTVALPSAPQLQQSLEESIRRRSTAGTFSGAAIALEELGGLLQLGCGVTRDGQLPLRAAPSPGALYAMEAYALAYNVVGLEAGLYHYAPLEHAVEQIRSSRGVNEIWSALPAGWHGEKPALAIVLSARLPRVQAKYGERGYRFALFESGHIAQNLLLTATALGLAAVSIGGFFDSALNSLIGEDGEKEAAMYAILIGRSETE